MPCSKISQRRKWSISIALGSVPVDVIGTPQAIKISVTPPPTHMALRTLILSFVTGHFLYPHRWIKRSIMGRFIEVAFQDCLVLCLAENAFQSWSYHLHVCVRHCANRFSRIKNTCYRALEVANYRALDLVAFGLCRVLQYSVPHGKPQILHLLPFKLGFGSLSTRETKQSFQTSD